LNDSMWSENLAVKVLTYRLLKKLWRNDLLDMMYMEDDELAWAEAEQEELRDSNWNILKTWDSVSVIKDLDVKWAWKTLKKWTTIKNIKACEVPWHVACKVDWFWNLYLKVEFLKKI
jgi:protein PhnA